MLWERKSYVGVKKMMEETTVEGSLSQDRLIGDRCRMCRKAQQNVSLQIALTKYLIQIIVLCKVCGTRSQLSRPRHHQVMPEPHNLSTVVTWEGVGNWVFTSSPSA